MDLLKLQSDYAKVIIGAGVDVKKGQLVHISCPVEAADFGRIVAEAAFKAGACDVFIEWKDTEFSKIRYTYASDEVLTTPPSFRLDMRKHFIDRGAALIVMNLVDTNEYDGIDPRKIAMASGALQALIAPANKFMFPNQCTFTSICIPDQKWANIVFPNDTNSLEKLWDKVCFACRTNLPDPINSWRDHLKNIRRLGALLKEYNFKKLHYKNALGTDLSMNLVNNNIWTGGGIAWGEKVFFPNLPTEEIFTAPDRLTVNGRAVSSMPLVHDGQLIEDFWFEFKDGKVVDFGAKKGYDTLKVILDTDDGAKYIGEAALVQYDSPISQLNTLFYTILFDENASCHLALGNAYPNCIEGSRGQSKEWLLENGLNVSKAHVDFMVGTKDLDIIGTDANGKEHYIFKNGNWAI